MILNDGVLIMQENSDHIRNQYELNKNNRFKIEFPKEFNITEWSVQKSDKPKFTNGKWENIKIQFIDPIAPSTSLSLFEIVKFLRIPNKDKVLFEIKIKSLDPTGVPTQEWIIKVEEVLTINFGELDYTNDNLQTPYIILKPFDCELNY